MTFPKPIKLSRARIQSAIRFEWLEPRLAMAADFSGIIAAIRSDTTADGVIGPADALRVINQLNSGASQENAPGILDVNNDKSVSSLDALMVINRLNANGVSNFDVESYWGEENAFMNDDFSGQAQSLFNHFNQLRDTKDLDATDVVNLVDQWLPYLGSSNYSDQSTIDNYSGPWFSQGEEVPMNEQNPESPPLGWTPFGNLGDQEEFGQLLYDTYKLGSDAYSYLTEPLSWTSGYWKALEELTDSTPTGSDSQGNNFDTYFDSSGNFTPAFWQVYPQESYDGTNWNNNSGGSQVYYDDDAPRYG